MTCPDATAAAPTTNAQHPEVERHRVAITLALRDHGIPKHMHGGVLSHVLNGLQVGSFLHCLLNGEVGKSSSIADPENFSHMVEWCSFLESNALPELCHGSPDRVTEWCRMGGLIGLGDKTPTQGVPAIADIPAPAHRPRPSMLITLSGDTVRKVDEARRALLTELAQPYLRADEIRKVVATLEMAILSANATQAESLRALR